ncbi:molybdopterin oxidoreductase family protein [Candidatus Epulonipiscium viviparus]|uniref:molybdopterin oxidoreductase family protein n=1 Tax=Candidatus Epulonipiscium viviparus TaxID=420336 RepID=UPI00016C01D6|nr:molybdopterin oxidoreductase family protein [Candidatus Epulopiscium viviparus]
MTVTQSTCNICSLACNLDFHVEGDKIVQVLPTKDYPVNKGFSCIKGLMIAKQHNVFKPSPLPKIRNENGQMEEKGWKETYKYLTDKLWRIKEEYGGDSIAVISTGQLPLEEMAICSHVFRNFLRGNVDGNTRLCMATSVVAYKQSFGFDAPPYTLNDIELSDVIFLIGANPVVAHPILWDRLRTNTHKQLVVIDPRRSETAEKADFHYAVNAKTDIYLFYGLANLLIERDAIDKKYIEEHTENFEGFKDIVKDFSIEMVAEKTGLAVADIENMVSLIQNGKNVSFWWTMGVNQSYEGVRTAQAIINLALMTGNIGRPGTGANSITGQCNAMGSRAFSNTAGLYGGGEYDDAARRKAVCEALNIMDKQLIDKPTLPYNVIMEKVTSGEIKALWIVSTNPRHSWTNNETFAAAIKKLKLFVVQDLYDDTDTAKEAGVFLPVVPGTKKTGVYINTERRLSVMLPVLNKAENEKTDYEVFYELGRELGMGRMLDFWKTPKDAFEIMKQCSAGMPCDITGVTYAALAGSAGIQWPYPEGAVLGSDERRLFENGQYYTANKKARFIFDKPVDNPLPTTAKFPYTLNTGRDTVGQWHTQVRSREIALAQDSYSKEAYIYIHPDLAAKYGIANNEKFLVSSINGQSAKFLAKISDAVKINQLYAPIHYIETNKLTPSLYDPFSKEPSYKTTPIAIAKI